MMSPTKQLAVIETAKPWQVVLRRGLFPQLTTADLKTLAVAVEEDDGRLIQKWSVVPNGPGSFTKYAECGCLISYVGIFSRGIELVMDVQGWFGRVCSEVDNFFDGGSGEVRYLLNWWDDTDRAEALAALGAEVRAELKRRKRLKID